MHGIEPQRLTNAELLNYAHLFGCDKLPADWVAELAKRLEKVEDVHENAKNYDDGYDKGYDDGYSEGYAAGQDEHAE